MSSPTYYFRQFRLHAGLGQLCDGKRQVSIEPRLLALLCYLVEHRDRIVPRQELLDAAGGGKALTDTALTAALHAIRRALGDSGREQRFVRTVHRRGYQFVAPTTVQPPQAAAAPSRDIIRFCRTRDGTRIAWAASGTGPPLVKTANWLSQLDLERTTPLFDHWFAALTRDRRLIRYDERGNGLSDWTGGFTMDEWIEDLDAVADAAALDRFPLLGVSQGGPLAVAYAARRPERVSRLVLTSAYARGRLARARDAAEKAEAALDLELTLAGWHTSNIAYQRFFGSQFFAGGPPEQWDDFTDYQKQTASAANGARFLEAQSRMDVSHLARQVSCPTLIVHSRDDPRVPVSQAAELANLIPDSRLILLAGRNHIVTASEQAWPAFLAELRTFLAEEDR